MGKREIVEVRANCALDLLRMGCALLVVWIHAVMWHAGAVGNAIYAIGHVAPPVFFLISGYFWRGASGVFEAAQAKRKTLRAVRMAIVWTAAYFAFSVALNAALNGRLNALTLGQWLPMALAPRSLLHYVVFQASVGYGVHTWYLSSAALSYLLMWGFYRLRLERFRLPLALSLLAVHTALHAAVVLLEIPGVPAEYLRNGWLVGFPLMLLGDWMRGAPLKKIPVWVWALASLVGLTFPVLEFFGFNFFREYLPGTIFEAFSLVALAICAGTNVDRPWAAGLRRFSRTLYLWHMMLVAPLQLLADARHAGAWAYLAIALAAVLGCLAIHAVKGRLCAAKGKLRLKGCRDK